jgi:hypothetical protein
MTRPSRTRSVTFFETDLRSAAETAAFAMEEHGLLPEEVNSLAEQLEDVIRRAFEEFRED